MDYNNITIDWLGHASFLIKGHINVYIDPFHIKKGLPKADIILITHGHYDHCSLKDIESILGESSIVIGPVDVRSKIGDVKFKMIHPGEELALKGIKIKAYPAYNINKEFHPKSDGGVGYLVNIENVSVYHTGDTDAIPELKELKNLDILLLPVGGTYTMDAQQAANFANELKPKIAIPMHFGLIIGSSNDAQRFKNLCTCPVEILGNL